MARLDTSFLIDLIRAKRGVTPDTAFRLERLFGMDAQFWLSGATAWGTSCEGMPMNSISRSERERVATQENAPKPQPNESVTTPGLPLAEAARQIGVTISAITRAACRAGGE